MGVGDALVEVYIDELEVGPKLDWGASVGCMGEGRAVGDQTEPGYNKSGGQPNGQGSSKQQLSYAGDGQLYQLSPFGHGRCVDVISLVFWAAKQKFEKVEWCGGVEGRPRGNKRSGGKSKQKKRIHGYVHYCEA